MTRSVTERGSWEWAACGASVTGSEHLRRGLGCDDAYAYALRGDFVAAVVADGAGSVTGTSAWGSYTACHGVLRAVMTGSFTRDVRNASPQDADAIMRWLFEGALDRVTRKAEVMGIPVARLATTLCVAVATPELTVFGQIGDGIIASERDGVITTHLREEKNEYANATWFLQSDRAFEESFRASAHRGLTAFALSTDGMAYKITNVVTGDPYEPFFTGSWQNVRSGFSAADLTAALRGIKDDQTGDDKTIVLAARDWAEDAFYPSPRPVRQTVVFSPPPAAIPRDGVRAPQQAWPDTQAAPARVSRPDGEIHGVVDRGALVNAGGRKSPPVDGVADRPTRAGAGGGGGRKQEVGEGAAAQRRHRWRTRPRRADQ